MNEMQQQQAPAPQATNSSAPSTPLSLVSTEQIQKYLDENKNLILAIMEKQSMGQMAESAQYQAILQKNLTYLAAIADAQPPPAPTSTPSQPSVTSTVAPQESSPMPQPQGTTMQQPPQQPGPPAPMLHLPVYPARAQGQQNQLYPFQQQKQQLQAHQSLGGGANGGMNLFMQRGFGSSGGLMDWRGNSGDHGHGNLGFGPVEGRE